MLTYVMNLKDKRAEPVVLRDVLAISIVKECYKVKSYTGIMRRKTEYFNMTSVASLRLKKKIKHEAPQQMVGYSKG